MLEIAAQDLRIARAANRSLTAGELKARIRTAAMDLFRRNAFEAVHIRHITEAAGVSRGMFYKAYRAKSDLLVEVLIEIDTALSALILSLQPTQPHRSFELLAEQADEVLRPYASIGPALAAEIARRPEFDRLGLRSTSDDAPDFATFARGLTPPSPYVSFDTNGFADVLARLWAITILDCMRDPRIVFETTWKTVSRTILNLCYQEIR